MIPTFFAVACAASLNAAPPASLTATRGKVPVAVWAWMAKPTHPAPPAVKVWIDAQRSLRAKELGRDRTLDAIVASDLKLEADTERNLSRLRTMTLILRLTPGCSDLADHTEALAAETERFLVELRESNEPYRKAKPAAPDPTKK